MAKIEYSFNSVIELLILRYIFKATNIPSKQTEVSMQNCIVVQVSNTTILLLTK